MDRSIKVSFYDDERRTFVDIDFLGIAEIAKEGGIYRLKTEVDGLVGSTAYLMSDLPDWIKSRRHDDELWLYIESNHSNTKRDTSIIFEHLMDADVVTSFTLSQQGDVYYVEIDGTPAEDGKVVITAERDGDDAKNVYKDTDVFFYVTGGRREFTAYLSKQVKQTYEGIKYDENDEPVIDSETDEYAREDKDYWADETCDKSVEIASQRYIGNDRRSFDVVIARDDDDDESTEIHVTDADGDLYKITLRFHGPTDIDESEHRYVLNVVHADDPLHARDEAHITYTQPTPEVRMEKMRQLAYNISKNVNWAENLKATAYFDVMEAIADWREPVYMGEVATEDDVTPNDSFDDAAPGETQKAYKLTFYQKDNVNGSYDEIAPFPNSFTKDSPIYVSAEKAENEYVDVKCTLSCTEYSANISTVEDADYSHIHKIEVEPINDSHLSDFTEYINVRVYNSEYPTLYKEVLWEHTTAVIPEPQDMAMSVWYSIDDGDKIEIEIPAPEVPEEDEVESPPPTELTFMHTIEGNVVNDHVVHFYYGGKKNEIFAGYEYGLDSENGIGWSLVVQNEDENEYGLVQISNRPLPLCVVEGNAIEFTLNVDGNMKPKSVSCHYKEGNVDNIPVRMSLVRIENENDKRKYAKVIRDTENVDLWNVNIGQTFFNGTENVFLFVKSDGTEYGYSGTLEEDEEVYKIPDEKINMRGTADEYIKHIGDFDESNVPFSIGYPTEDGWTFNIETGETKQLTVFGSEEQGVVAYVCSYNNIKYDLINPDNNSTVHLYVFRKGVFQCYRDIPLEQGYWKQINDGDYLYPKSSIEDNFDNHTFRISVVDGQSRPIQLNDNNNSWLSNVRFGLRTKATGATPKGDLKEVLYSFSDGSIQFELDGNDFNTPNSRYPGIPSNYEFIIERILLDVQYEYEGDAEEDVNCVRLVTDEPTSGMYDGSGRLKSEYIVDKATTGTYYWFARYRQNDDNDYNVIYTINNGTERTANIDNYLRFYKEDIGNGPDLTLKFTVSTLVG